ncbi:hypothetical protein BC829DRAFT_221035 [Chytridium lagenaria]|nr:hypothetical protein BC829DRAFT_221035 [Chytridium lagenaria]
MRLKIGSGAVHYDIDTMSSPSIVIANTCDMKEKLGYIPLRSIGEEEKDLRETWFTGEKMRSAPWIMKEGDKRIPWIGLENDIDELLKVMSREESIVTLIIWNDEPISTILNHIHSLVTRGNMPSYIVAANATLSKCISLNLPCWNIEDAQIIGSKLILALLRKSVTVHLSDTKLTYTGSVKAAYTDFTSDIVVKQNIDSPYQIHTENAYIRSTPRSIRLLEHLQPSTGFSESILEAPSDAWVPCFTSEECTTLSSNDRATVASICTPLNAPTRLHPLNNSFSHSAPPQSTSSRLLRFPSPTSPLCLPISPLLFSYGPHLTT